MPNTSEINCINLNETLSLYVDAEWCDLSGTEVKVRAR